VRGIRVGAGGLALVRGGLALVQLAAPAAVGRVAGLDPGDRRALVAVRVLGARELAQSAAAATGSPALRTAGGWVDGLHAASMVGLAAASPRYRRPALVAAALATAWAATARAPR
jgi:hypothetical protein